MHQQPEEASSDDPEVLRAALIREADERRRAECSAKMQTEVVQLALDLLVREPDLEGFFGVFAKTLVEETESHGCGVWLIDDDHHRCDLWMAYMSDRLYTSKTADWDTLALPRDEHGGTSVRLHRRDGPRASCTRATIRACPNRFGTSTGVRASA